MTKNNGSSIGITERKEIAKIIEKEYNELISQMQNEIVFTEGEIYEEASKKFGIKVIDQEIKNLEKKIELLKEKNLTVYCPH